MSNLALRIGARGPRSLTLLLTLCLALGVPMASSAQEDPQDPEGQEAAEQQRPLDGDRIREEIQRDIDAAFEEVEEEIERRSRRGRSTVTSDAKVAIGSNVTVEADEVAREVVAVGGDLKVEGEVLGDAVAIGGSVEITGKVTGNVASIGNRVILREGAQVLGDVTSVGGEVEREPNVDILGEVREVAFVPGFSLDFDDWPDIRWHRGPWWRPFRYTDGLELVSAVLRSLFLVLFVCLIFLVARPTVEKVSAQLSPEPWKAGLVGLLIEVLFVPVFCVVCVILAVSIVGIPLLVLLVLALPFVALAVLLVGFTSVAHTFGSWINRRFGWSQTSAYLILLLGVAAIQGSSLLGDFFDLVGGPLVVFAVLFGLFGFVVKYVAWTVGLGAVFLTRFGGRSKREAPALPPPPPTPGSEPATRTPVTDEATPASDALPELESSTKLAEEAAPETGSGGQGEAQPEGDPSGETEPDKSKPGS